MNKKLGITLGAVGVLAVVCGYAYAMPKTVNGVLDASAKQVLAQQAESYQAEQLESKTVLDPEAELMAYFERTMTQEEYDMLVDIGIRTTMHDLSGSNVSFSEDHTKIIFDNGDVDSMWLTMPFYSVELEVMDDETEYALSMQASLAEEQYLFEGLRPSSTLKLAKGSADEVYYDDESGIIVCPETRDLTQENFLQMVDFAQRMEYADRKYTGYLDAVKALEARSDVVPKETLVQTAKAVIAGQTGDNLDDMHVTFYYQRITSVNETPSIELRVEPYHQAELRMSRKEFSIYYLTFNPYSGALEYYSRSLLCRQEGGNIHPYIMPEDAVTDTVAIASIQSSIETLAKDTVTSISVRTYEDAEASNTYTYVVNVQNSDTVYSVQIDMNDAARSVRRIQIWDAESAKTILAQSTLIPCELP